MTNNFVQRIVSAILLGGTLVYLLIKYERFYKLFFVVILVLIVLEWFKINKDKKSLLFYSGLLYISFPIMWLINLPGTHKNLEILWLFSIVWSCDTFAYLGGKLIGGPKFSPKISPKKTWSGVIVGSICAFVISYIYVKYTFDKQYYIRLLFTPFLIISAILGDLLESKIKRILGIKDSGNIIPGHGGILDRFDSFILTTYMYMFYTITESICMLLTY